MEIVDDSEIPCVMKTQSRLTFVDLSRITLRKAMGVLRRGLKDYLGMRGRLQGDGIARHAVRPGH